MWAGTSALANRPSVSTEVNVGPSSSTQNMGVQQVPREHVCGSFICKQPKPPQRSRDQLLCSAHPVAARGCPTAERLPPWTWSPEWTRRDLRAGVVCVATRTCTHASVLTTLGRKRGGGPGDGQSEAGGPGQHGGRAWWEGAAASLHPPSALSGGSACGPGAHWPREATCAGASGETPLGGPGHSGFP